MMEFEIMHHMKRKHSGGEGEIALKVDISKAYDRVDWNYLKHRMSSMGMKQWDVGRIKAHFLENNAKAIITVPLPQREVKNMVVWVESTDGEGWKKIWRLALPHIFKIFLWRFCTNTIPVINRLSSKGVNLSDTCPMCSMDAEHLLHVFFNYQFASQCWGHMGVSYDMQNVTSASEWLINKLGTCMNAELIKIVEVLWGVWFRRNRRVWDDKIVSHVIAMDWSVKVVIDWQKAQ
ncbi:uncharacterized protein LOC141714621 [Apium graveolens]|uniref:uncharacterized protein LOC141714621 n=1 Tax=Apium graveolens TaxID=4045 RepID=UPI003D79950B